jgi:DNA polymerase III subunit delta
MNCDEILADLKKKIYKPVYLLMGEEAYFIDQVSDYIAAHVLTADEKTFNQTIFYGPDSDVGSIINAARRYPMMANYQVVMVREAQELKKFEELYHYVERPLKSTILVLCYKYKSVDKRKKIVDLVKKNGLLFESKILYDNQVPDWVNAYLKQRGRSIDPNAVRMLGEFLGNDLGKIANELEKLFIILPDVNHRISPDDIERNIGFSKEYNNFELQKALAQKDILKSNRIINFFGHNPGDNPLTVTISSLHRYFANILQYHFLEDKSKNNVAAALRISPFFVGEYETAARKYPINKLINIMSYLREYDLKSKGMGNPSATEADLLKELVYKILH